MTFIQHITACPECGAKLPPDAIDALVQREECTCGHCNQRLVLHVELLGMHGGDEPHPKFPLQSFVRDIMKGAGCQIVARDVLAALVDHVEHRLREISKAALKLTTHARRTKITREDLDLALKMKPDLAI